MKEKFLNSKSKKVLIAMCEQLDVNCPKILKTPKPKLIKLLLEFSYSVLIFAYKETKA
jgi:hypothetical protein